MSAASPFKPVNSKESLPKLEHEVLDFWEKNNIFEKSVEMRCDKEKFVFFDGPPFANGLPHYGHILASSLKDAVTRYFSMRGYYIPRVNGWDCHGLPVEYEIEKELKLTGRKDIEKMGVENFNAACRESVFRYTKEWRVLLKRIFRWVDFDNEYATLSNDYMESIWWVFKEIWKKKMVYQDYKSMHICWRCETPLSNFEVTLGYKEVSDLSITVKFKLLDEPNTYLLAWTTTPWTMPAHMYINVGPDIEYVKVKYEDDFYILAKAAIERNFKGKECEIVESLTAKDLEGRRYQPPFDYFKEWKNCFQIFIYPEVLATEGTGLVHMVPAFGGEDEVTFMRSKNIEPIIHVKMDGTFTKEVKDWAGNVAKAEVHHIKDNLEKRGLLFSSENYLHSYPHCWRCDTPLLSYLTKSWFIKVTQIKDKLLKNNKKIKWIPDHIQEGRFGKWLEGARDWNVSRNRFWGCPIPVWQCEQGHQKCLGSLKELREFSTKKTTLYVLRHGEAEQNALKIVNSDLSKKFNLTSKGKKQALSSAKKLVLSDIEVVYASPLMRAQQTAEIIADQLKLNVLTDERLTEHTMGEMEGASEKEYFAQFKSATHRYSFKNPGGGESFADVEKRVIAFLNEILTKYRGKKIVIVAHLNSLRAIARYLKRLSVEETFELKGDFAQLHEFNVGQLPLRGNELDLHKPYIDEIELQCETCGKNMKRIPEVLDCWFESGAMPYAQLHYPFENKKDFEENFPANFIAEGVDQTRGWFYTLHVLATILFDKPAFKNIIVNGILLAADGEKLSKRKKNYPDPSLLFETHGVDSTRFFLYTSTAPLAQDVRFSEKHVEEIVKQFTLPLWNVYSFFVTYANIDGWTPSPLNLKSSQKTNKLDTWILSELNALIQEVTTRMDSYNLTLSTRPMLSFVDKLSNWYIRRSRRRFWKSESDEDKKSAYATLYEVLVKMSMLLAPFMPATADSIFKNLTGKESVHFEDWPQARLKLINQSLNEEVELVRTIVSLTLKLRAKNNLKVRQPLATLKLALPQKASRRIVEEYKEVILEELNVKEISFEDESSIATFSITVDSRKIGPRFGKETQEIIRLSKASDYSIQKNGSVHFPKTGKALYVLSADEVVLGYKGKEGHDIESAQGVIVSLDTKVTPELKQEGYAREIIRFIQELRKKAEYGISDRIYLYVESTGEIRQAVTTFTEMIARETLALELVEKGDFEWDKEEVVEIEGKKVKLAVRK